MKILALDTASSWCAAAVYDSGTDTVLAEVSEDIGKGHAEVLMDYIERTMAQSGIAMSELDRVAVNVGPGSFTGVRIGVSAARGFALALDRPAIGVSAFDALASEVATSHPGQPALILLEAHRGEIYAQGFGADGEATTGPMVLAREEALLLIQQLYGQYRTFPGGLPQYHGISPAWPQPTALAPDGSDGPARPHTCSSLCTVCAC